MIKFIKDKDQGYYRIIDSKEKDLGWIAPSPFGRGWLVGKNNQHGGVAFRTVAQAKKFARATIAGE